MIDWALYYRRMGCAVQRLHPGEKRPIGAQWNVAPVPSEEEIATQFHPNDNLGLRPGYWCQPAEGYALVVVDVDVRFEDEMATAVATAEAFLGRPLHDHPVVRSSQWSRHVWVLVPRDRIPKTQLISGSPDKFLCPATGRNRRRWEVMLMSTGSNVVLPPSLHPDYGTRYEWIGALPHERIPALPEASLAKLEQETTEVVVTQDQPPVLPLEMLPPVSDLVLSAAQKRLLTHGEAYQLSDNRSNDILGLSSLLLLQGLDRQVVLSLLVHHAPGLIAQEPPHNARDPATWLWRYGMQKALSNETPEAFRTYQLRIGAITEEPEVDAWNEMLTKARQCRPDDPDLAVLLYYTANKEFGALRAAMVADTLKDAGFSITALKTDAKKRGKDLARKVARDAEGVAPVVHSYPHGEAWRDPRHPIHTGEYRSAWDELIARYVFIPKDNRWYDLERRVSIGPEGLNMKLARVIRDILVEDGADPDELPRNPRATEFLVNRDTVVMADGETFYPGANGPIVEWEGATFVNRWIAPALDRRKVTTSEVAVWLNHLTYIFPQEAYRAVLLDWLAWVIQNQGQKVNWQLVIGGTPRCGKDTIWNMPIRHAIGDRYVSDVPFEVMNSQYDDWRVDKKFLVIQESHQSRKSDWHSIENRLKTICAAPPETVHLNPKTKATIVQPNLSALIFTTNERDGFMVEDMGRFHMLWTDAQVKPPEYYAHIYQWLQEGGAQRVAQWLWEYPVSPAFDPKTPPRIRTEWAEAVLFAGVSPTQRKIRDAVEAMRRQGRTFVAPEQIHDYLRGEELISGHGFLPGPDKISAVLQGFGMRPLTNANNRPELAVPKALLTTGGIEGSLTDTRTTSVFPLTPEYVAATPADIWRGLCPPSYRDQLEVMIQHENRK
jgi:hypothetical protein